MNLWDGLFLEDQCKKGETTTKKKQLRAKSISKLAPSKASVHKDSERLSLRKVSSAPRKKLTDIRMSKRIYIILYPKYT